MTGPLILQSDLSGVDASFNDVSANNFFGGLVSSVSLNVSGTADANTFTGETMTLESYITTTGDIYTTGTGNIITMGTGDIVSISGDIVASDGNIVDQSGNIIATLGDIIAQAGDIKADSGNK